jgi:hypothetical protein
MPALRRGLPTLVAWSLLWAIPMLVDFNDTSMLRLHAPSALLWTAAATTVVGLLLMAAGDDTATLGRLPAGLRTIAAVLLVAAIGFGYAATVSPTLALQNSDLDDAFLYEVAAHSHDGKRAAYVTRSYDDRPDRGIHLFHPHYLLERGDRWVGIEHFESDQPRRPGEAVYHVAGVRCYAHRRDGKALAAAGWKHPACADFCQRHRCRPVFEHVLDNVGERAFPWYPASAELAGFEVGLYEVDPIAGTTP